MGGCVVFWVGGVSFGGGGGHVAAHCCLVVPRRPSRRGGARSAPAAPHGRISSNKKAAY